jgi:flavorubredoxin
MSVSPISAQVAQAAQASSQNTPNVSTTVTSTDSTALQNQVSQLSSAITQLQSHGGSASQVQKLQQAMQTAKSQILKQEELVEEKKASAQAANIQLAVKSKSGLNVQA